VRQTVAFQVDTDIRRTQLNIAKLQTTNCHNPEKEIPTLHCCEYPIFTSCLHVQHAGTCCSLSKENWDWHEVQNIVINHQFTSRNILEERRPYVHCAGILSWYRPSTMSSWSQDIVVGIAARLRAEQSGARILTEAKVFPPTYPDRLRGPPSPLFDGYRAYFPALKWPRLATHFDPVSRLRMSGAILLLPLYAFVEWTRITLRLHVILSTVPGRPHTQITLTLKLQRISICVQDFTVSLS
jgi:hypothetical protein